MIFDLDISHAGLLVHLGWHYLAQVRKLRS